MEYVAFQCDEAMGNYIAHLNLVLGLAADLLLNIRRQSASDVLSKAPVSSQPFTNDVQGTLPVLPYSSRLACYNELSRPSRGIYPLSLAIRLHTMIRTLDDLRRHENFDWNQIIVYYAGHGLQSLYSGAVPTYDARQSRRRRLNAPELREDNSQSSESRERERENGTPLSMALVVILIGKNVAIGKCSTCPARFKNAKEFYDHLCGSLHARNQT